MSIICSHFFVAVSLGDKSSNQCTSTCLTLNDDENDSKLEIKSTANLWAIIRADVFAFHNNRFCAPTTKVPIGQVQTAKISSMKFVQITHFLYVNVVQLNLVSMVLYDYSLSRFKWCKSVDGKSCPLCSPTQLLYSKILLSYNPGLWVFHKMLFVMLLFPWSVDLLTWILVVYTTSLFSICMISSSSVSKSFARVILGDFSFGLIRFCRSNGLSAALYFFTILLILSSANVWYIFCTFAGHFQPIHRNTWPSAQCAFEQWDHVYDWCEQFRWVLLFHHWTFGPHINFWWPLTY